MGDRVDKREKEKERKDREIAMLRLILEKTRRGEKLTPEERQKLLKSKN